MNDINNGNVETTNVSENKTDLIPCNTGVLIELYAKNPHNKIEKTSNGIIIGAEGGADYVSKQTGEIEENDLIIACAKVIAIGPKCENVKVGEDIYCNKQWIIPVPYMKKGYYILSEQNVICRVANK